MGGIGSINAYWTGFAERINLLKYNAGLLQELRETGSISKPLKTVAGNSGVALNFGSTAAVNELAALNYKALSGLNNVTLTALERAKEAYTARYGHDWFFNIPNVDETA